MNELADEFEGWHPIDPQPKGTVSTHDIEGYHFYLRVWVH